MKHGIWPALALALAGIVPAACSQSEQEQAPTGPEAPAGVTVNNARLMLPPVAGNPGAVYFDLVNSGDRAVTVRAASVQGAQSATIHQMSTGDGEATMNEVLQITTPAGETLSFAPGGLHVMANSLADTVVAGGTAEVTLTFAGGDKLSFPAEVRAAGDER